MKTSRSLRVAGFTAALSFFLSLAGAFAQDAAKTDGKPADKKPAKAEADSSKKKPAPAKKPQPKADDKKTQQPKVEVRVRAAEKKEPAKPKIERHGGITLMRPATEHRSDWKPRPWLGIAMRPVPDSLREYLELDEGFGVQVEHVVEESPAHKASLQVHDVITRLDDQHIISPEHVALLVRSKKKGAKIEVSYIRKGKEQKAQVTLGEKALPPFSNAPMRAVPQPKRPEHGTDPHHRDHHLRSDSKRDGNFEFRFGEPGKEGHFEFRLPGDSKDHEQLRREIESWGGMLKKWMENNPDALRFDWGGEGMKMRPFDPPKPVEPKKNTDNNKGAKTTPKPIPVLPGKPGSGKPPAIMVNPGYPLAVVGNAGIVKIDNPKGEVTITSEGDDQKITIKNEDGETVYDGPYKDGPESLPKEAQEQLKVMKLNNLKILMNRTSIQGAPKKADTPPAKPKTKTSPKNNDKGELL